MLASNAGLVDVMFQIARTKVWIRVKFEKGHAIVAVHAI